MRRLNLEEMTGTNSYGKYILLALTLILICLFLEIWIATRLSTTGDKIEALKRTQTKTEIENLLLENQIASRSSLPEVEKEAIQLGFVNLNDVLYIKSTKTLASLDQ